MLDAIIDKLTQSIEEQATGRVLDTEVRRANLADVDCLEGSQRMFLDTKAAARLVETYFGGK